MINAKKCKFIDYKVKCEANTCCLEFYKILTAHIPHPQYFLVGNSCIKQQKTTLDALCVKTV